MTPPPDYVTGINAVFQAGYIRQSTARENKSEASPATQRGETRKASARYPDATWVGFYEDIGISAFSGVERPGFERLLADCRSGRVNMVIVYYVSRLSRLDPLDAIPIVTELLNLGVTIVSVMEGEFRRGNLMDLIHLIMRLDAAYRESKNKSEAILGAKRLARELGGYVGGKPPYGFSLTRETRLTADGAPVAVNALAIDPAEAEVIRRVWATIEAHGYDPFTPDKRRSNPGSLTGICNVFNEDGTPTRGNTIGKATAGSSWHPKTLKRILRDPRIAGYAADVVYVTRADGRKSSQIDHYRLVRDPETMDPLRPHPEILAPDAWHALQVWLDGRGRGQGLSRGASLLGSLRLLYCESGDLMKSNNSPLATHRANYACIGTRRRRRPDDHTGTCAISQHRLDEYVARRIMALIATAEDDPETLDILAEAARLFGVAAQSPETAAERTALVAERADAARALEMLYDDRESGGYDGAIGKTRFLVRVSTLSERLLHTEARIAALEALVTPTLPIGEWLGEPGTDPIGPGSWWHAAPRDARRALVRLFVRRIVVMKTSPGNPTRPDIADRVRVDWVGHAEVTRE